MIPELSVIGRNVIEVEVDRKGKRRKNISMYMYIYTKQPRKNWKVIP
jgi:hypothetical protein